MHTRSDNNAAVFFWGMIVGGVAAALLTPRSGDDTRRHIRRKLDSLKDEMKTEADGAAESAEDHLGRVRNAVHRARGKLQGDEQGSAEP